MWPFNAIAGWLDAWGIRKGILVTPYRLDDIRQHLVETGFEIAAEVVFGNCYEVLIRKPLASPVTP
jgi:tRNA A22 N-methylase